MIKHIHNRNEQPYENMHEITIHVTQTRNYKFKR